MTTPLIDCHAHFYPPNFSISEIETILSSIQDNGSNIRSIITVPETIEEAHQVLSLSKKYPMINPSAGLHPVQQTQTATGESFARSATHTDLPPILDFISTHHESLTSIGECGLDFSPHILATTHTGPIETQKEIQKSIFTSHITLAKSHSIPLNIHSRSAGHHAISLLREHNAPPSLLHAFDGRPSHALNAVQLGHYLSIAPIVVRSPQLQKLVQAVPLDHLVLETDSPALCVEKGGRNTPLELEVACREVARLKAVDVEEVRRITTENARKLFTKLREV
ncbi:putative deoxyribonuclease tatdn3 [Rhizophlyctis rosea]|uniref:Deoxyribonuclease tatdn3 n=1 Tax=Rhizophlyctis rosea TaxID=64517 RepID=A0AAD5S4J5_9FUNG|nr:putative deoxyribonuclease tatdn3 [Rhizophlyctis rosea]